MARQWTSVLLGHRIPTREEASERIGPARGIAVLGLDALASAAYGPEAFLTALLPLGWVATAYVVPTMLVIVAVLGIVTLSYRQTIAAYPGGGGSYTVAKENLGTYPGLLAAAALSLDYILNVAVAISAGVGALVSAVPILLPHTLELTLVVLLLLTVVNLRGVRSTGGLFLLPTYLFVGCLLVTVAIGAAKTALASDHPTPIAPLPPPEPTLEATSVWLLLRAFSSGCTAMTGIEAVSNGVPIFSDPSQRGAQRTLTAISTLLAVLLLGIAAIAHAYGITATPPGHTGYESLLSQLIGAVSGRTAFYYVAIGAIVTVLTLSANTSFADFPRLCRLLALDGFLPETFEHRGRRLVFSHGILVLSALAAILLVVFDGVTDRLIPLFAIGAFLAFTLSQLGMVMHWKRKSGRHAHLQMVVNGAGAIATAVTLVIMTGAKLTEGAWISMLLVATLVALYMITHHRTAALRLATSLPGTADLRPFRRLRAVVPIRRWDCGAQKALRLALTMSHDVTVVQVLTQDRPEEDLRKVWRDLVGPAAKAADVATPRLVVLVSEYRLLFAPILEYVRALAETDKTRLVAVVLHEVVEPRWYHVFLHGSTTTLFKGLLLFRGGPRIVVVDVPWYLDVSPGEPEAATQS